MPIRTRHLLAASGVALMLLRPQAHAACNTKGGMIDVPMQQTAEQAETDPAGVWTKWEMWNPSTPARTTIWSGTACGGEVIVSQIVNRQCSSAAICPARVVLRQGSTQHVLLDYKQVCTLHQTFRLHADLSALEACGQSVPLTAAR
jgi:hypothetical protein